jgi:hexosaminidase
MTPDPNFEEASARLANLIPRPNSSKYLGGISFLSGETEVIYQEDHSALSVTASYIREKLLSPSAAPSPNEPAGTIRKIDLQLANEARFLNEEAYVLEIDQANLSITASHPDGIFMGANTLLQLALPTRMETKGICVPHCTIADSPRFIWRGMMLDVARHFFSVADVKRVIDLLAIYKLNRLHLHLSDDQGWRIEIKSWPNLTEIGGCTQVGGGQGGFYTQEDYVELVSYAQDRRIMIVPEIDLPGHTNAALASYGELNPNGIAPDLYTGMEVGFSSLAIGKSITYQFVSDVLSELGSLTPGPYLHIGGDEAKSTSPDDYKHFIEKTQQIVRALGKQMIGWQEISTTALAPGSIVQYWTDHAALAKLPEGVDVIMSPASRAYLDMKYHEAFSLGLNWAGYLNVQDAFTWDPQDYLDVIPPDRVLGLEAPLWSETLETLSDIEQMMFPRLLGYSEMGWSRYHVGDFEEFGKRIAFQGKLLDRLGVNYYRSGLIDWGEDYRPAIDE